jgi:hypothetical protein
MTKRKQYVRHAQDFVSEELVAVLLEKPSYDFHEVFAAVYEKLRARNSAGGGKEMLRLRVYEKLHILVTQGLVKKEEKRFSAVKPALRVRVAEMAEAKANFQARRSSVLHTE